MATRHGVQSFCCILRKSQLLIHYLKLKCQSNSTGALWRPYLTKCQLLTVSKEILEKVERVS